MFELSHWVELYGATVGYSVITGIIFAETGLFFGFFLPGDSILFPAGLLASQGYLNIYVLCSLVFVASVGGNLVGYGFGKQFGKRLFYSSESVFFHKDHILRAKKFYDKHGGKTIILARFLPIIRTFGPIIAGISEMNLSKFILYSAIGGAAWAIGLPVAGFYLGKFIPDVDKFLLPIILLVIFLSILPALIELVRTKERRVALVSHAHRLLKRKRTK